MSALLSGTPKPRPPLRVGDRVLVIQDPNDPRKDLSGWILNLPDGRVRIAFMACDDGRPDPPEDWGRATRPLSEVTVWGIS